MSRPTVAALADYVARLERQVITLTTNQHAVAQELWQHHERIARLEHRLGAGLLENLLQRDAPGSA